MAAAKSPEGESLPCRCGWDGTGDHPCHGFAYTCRKASSPRYYAPTMMFALAGAQMKISAVLTHACDDCWRDFSSGERK